MNCIYCGSDMKETGVEIYKEEADPFLMVTYREWEYTCENMKCQGIVYVSNNRSDPGPYWVPGRP